jgi:hypothetical protein
LFTKWMIAHKIHTFNDYISQLSSSVHYKVSPWNCIVKDSQYKDQVIFTGWQYKGTTHCAIWHLIWDWKLGANCRNWNVP